MEIIKLFIEILSLVLLPIAILAAAIIGSNAYRDQKIYDRKESFYLDFLKDFLKIISLLKHLDAKNNKKPINDFKLQNKMKEFNDKHGPNMMLYATPRFKRVFEKSFRTTKNKSGNSYTPLVMMSVLIEEAKKDLNKKKSKSMDERIGNLAIYTSTNDIRNEKEFIAEMKKTCGLFRRFREYW